MDVMKPELDELVARLQQAAGENLESVVLYGSAARGDFSENYSDLNLICILRKAGLAALDQLSPVLSWWSKTRGHPPPLFVTAEELQSSADVFAIEMLDAQASHRVLAGRDVLSGIAVPMNLHRVQLEHELRTALLRLRQHYLLFASDDAALERVLAKSATSVIVLVRHALVALGHAAPSDTKREVLAKAAAVLGLDVTPLQAALDLREDRRIQSGVAQVYQRCIDLLMAVASRVDQAIPKQEWERVRRQ
jgi:predicted nucleotidyltransferase